ncbi:LysR family transcriptional regulator [Providencia rettgeri]
MLRLEDLTLFVRAAAFNSFSDAAREANIHPAQVSSAIKRLESILAIRLFARSTRNMRLTPEGEVWLPYARQMLDIMHIGLQKIQVAEDEVLGTLQIAAPSDLGRNLLLPILLRLRHHYPKLHFRLFVSDQITNVFKNPVDVAFRYGNINDASYVALPVAPANQRVLIASPKWIAKYGEPKNPEDLMYLNALTFAVGGRSHDQWTFTQNGKSYSIPVDGTIMSNDADIIRHLAILGEGVAYKSWLDVSNDVREGRLKLMMTHYQGEHVPLNMICPHRHQLSTAVRLLYSAVKEHCDTLESPFS